MSMTIRALTTSASTKLRTKLRHNSSYVDQATYFSNRADVICTVHYTCTTPNHINPELLMNFILTFSKTDPKLLVTTKSLFRANCRAIVAIWCSQELSLDKVESFFLTRTHSINLKMCTVDRGELAVYRDYSSDYSLIVLASISGVSLNMRCGRVTCSRWWWILVGKYHFT